MEAIFKRTIWLSLLIVAAILPSLGCGGGGGGPVVGVAAGVINVQTSGTGTGAQVTFTVNVTGTAPFTYAWDFGGGATPDVATTAQPAVVLGAVGTYSGTVIVDNDFGSPAVYNFTFTVTGGGGGNWPTDPAQLTWLTSWYIPLPDLGSANRVFQDAANVARADAALALFNQERGNVGAAPLTREPHLEALAMAHCWNMAMEGFFDHDTPSGLGILDRLQAINPPPSITSYAENIGAGPNTAATMINAWMGSAGHRANILDTNFTHVGIAVYYRASDPQGYNYFWTAVFAPISGDPAVYAWIEPGDTQP